MRLVTTLGVLAALEIYSRIMGIWDYRVKKRDHVVWDMAWSTKDPGRGVEQRETSVEVS
jgi:hypothetical protein